MALLRPPPKRKTPLDYYNMISTWQQQTGRLGHAPPKDWHVGCSNFIQYWRSHRDDPRAVAIELMFAPLGISFEPGSSSVANPKDIKRPKGLSGCAEAIRRVVEGGSYPTLFSSDAQEREHAGWLVRIQFGILSTRHISSDLNAPLQVYVRDLVETTRSVQSDKNLACEWYLFSLRLNDFLTTAKRGDGWCRLACARPASLYPDHELVSSLVRTFRSPTSHLPHPVAVIAKMNRVLGAVASPVTSPLDRPATLHMTSRLLSAGFHLTNDY